MSTVRGTLLVACLLAPAPLLAQAQPGQNANDQPRSTAEVAPTSKGESADVDSNAGATARDGDEDNEIVVTAQRREENLSNVPISVTALNQESLDERGVRNIADLSRIAPAVSFVEGFAGTTEIAIRGISSSIGTGTTGIYIDNTPIQIRALGAGQGTTNPYPQIFDLERVEVLRGPQGTLFGAGSEGGTVRFITPAPNLNRQDVYARGELGFTEGGKPVYEGGIAFGAPILNDTLGFRVSGMYRREDGWIDRADPLTGAILDRNINSNNTAAFRAAVRLKVGGFELTPSVYYQRQKRAHLPFFWRTLSDPGDGKFVTGDYIRQPGVDKYTLYSLSGKYDFGFSTLAVDTSYFDRKNPTTVDYTGVIPDLLGLDELTSQRYGVASYNYFSQPQKTFTAESRLESNGVGPWKWVFGGFYQLGKQRASQTILSPDFDTVTLGEFGGTVEQVFGLPLLEPGGIIYFGRDRSRDEQLAAFGQLDYELVSNLTVTLGARVARVKSSSANMQGGPFNGGDSAFSSEQKESPFTPKLGVNFKPNENSLLYATAAKGFRMGGGNTPVPQAQCGDELASLGFAEPPTGYTSDNVWSYEVGAKAKFSRAVQFQTSAYFIKWKEIQSNILLATCGFSFIGNLGRATSKGGDVHVTLRPIQGLTLDGSVAYTDAAFDKTVYGGELPSGSRGILINKGDPLLVSPWTVTISADYEHAIAVGTDVTAYFHSDYSSASGYNFGRENTPAFDPLLTRQGASQIANLRFGARVAGGAYDVSLFVNNVFNSRDILFSWNGGTASSPLKDTSYRPRTVGLTVIYRP